MNDRIFDLLYKLEQREIVERVRQQELLNRNMPVREPISRLIWKGILRIWQRVLSKLVKEKKGSVDNGQLVKTATRISH